MPSATVVSLCLPTYGRARLLGETIESALRQTLTDFELIVVDDASPDDTAAITAAFTDPRVRYVRNDRNLGVPANYNRAYALATGEFVLLLEDHDLLDPQFLERIVDVFRRHPNVGFVATALEVIDEHGRPVRTCSTDFPEAMRGRRMLRRLLTRTSCPFSLTVAVRRACLAGLSEPFPSAHWWYADVDLWMKLSARTDFGYVPAPLLKFRERENNHPLADKEWESLLCVDGIHRANWALLHPRWSIGAAIDAVQYECGKLWRVAIYRMSRAVRRAGPWSSVDRDNTAAYLTPPARAAIALMGLVPPAAWQVVRAVVRH